MTKQEMFDKAWRGLKSQGWQQAAGKDGICTYLDEATGRRCAWGWVDPEHTPGCNGAVQHIHDDGIGVAAKLDGEELSFAKKLQAAHDCYPSQMEIQFREIAVRHNLTIPDEAAS